MKDVLICKDTAKHKFYLGLENWRYETTQKNEGHERRCLAYFHAFETLAPI